jgi:hypothetical protein
MRTDRDGGPRTAPLLVAVAVVLGAVLVAGCGAPVEGAQAAQVADAFTDAETTDPSAACARLAPETVKTLEKDGGSCEQALADAGLPAAGKRRAVEVAGHSAQVRYTGDTVFLARFDDGWRVTAAGCERESDDPSEPYDCAVDGG